MSLVAVPPVLRLLRPHHWIKNAFVFAGILFGHQWHDLSLWQDLLLIFLGFSLTASAVYAFNDVADRERDRLHPAKRHRPVASGAISPGLAVAIGVAAVTAGLGLAALASRTALVIVLGYFVMNIAYSWGLKHIVVLDVFIIALGFMLRILAGTLGVDIPASQWLLVTGFMVTLFLGFAKRHAELAALASGEDHRRVLSDYSREMLDLMIGVTAAGTIIAYSLYTVSEHAVSTHGTTALVYTVPLVAYGLFRYLFLLMRRGQGGDPVTDVFRDPHLLVVLLLWLGSVLLMFRVF